MSVSFENKKYLKLSPTSNSAYNELVSSTIPSGEEILQTFKAGRDGVVFTTKRLIAINVQGVTGKQKSLTVIPYSKINAYEVETAAVIDLDSTLTVWVGALGEFTFEFSAKSNVAGICRCINQCQ